MEKFSADTCVAKIVQRVLASSALPWEVTMGERPGDGRPFQPVDEARLQHARQEHTALARQSATFSLRDGFEYPGFSIEKYCRDYHPNPLAEAVGQNIREWALHYDIWIPGISEYCHDILAFLHPKTEEKRLVAIGKCLAVDWYLNDSIGREWVPAMTLAQQKEAMRTRQHIVNISRRMPSGPYASRIDEACVEMLLELRDLSAQPDWFSRFLDMWVCHVQRSCGNVNPEALGWVSDLLTYLKIGPHQSGLHYTLTQFEFGRDSYLNWSKLGSVGLENEVRRLWWLCTMIAGISNDLFSFEKEFIRHGSRSNFVVMLMLNRKELSLDGAIEVAILSLRKLIEAFIFISKSIKGKCAEKNDAALFITVETFMQSVEWGVMSTWVWQTASQRYKSPHSIFRETRS